MKETQNNNKTKIIIAVVAIAIIAIIGLAFFNSSKSNENIQEQIVELENKEASLRAKQDVIFKTEGFTEEYYQIDNELGRIRDEIWELESKERNSLSKQGIFALFPIISILIFVTVFITVFTTIIRTAKMSKHGIVHPNEKVGHDMEKMATMMSKVAVNMAKEMNPEYKALKCPNCGAGLTDDVEVCEYCDAPLTKVVASGKRK